MFKLIFHIIFIISSKRKSSNELNSDLTAKRAKFSEELNFKNLNRDVCETKQQQNSDVTSLNHLNMSDFEHTDYLSSREVPYNTETEHQSDEIDWIVDFINENTEREKKSIINNCEFAQTTTKEDEPKQENEIVVDPAKILTALPKDLIKNSKKVKSYTFKTFKGTEKAIELFSNESKNFSYICVEKMHFKSNVKFENYYTEIRLYFKNYLSNFNLLKYDKILVDFKICNFSKQLSVNLPTVSTSKFLHKNFSFISYLLNITITLERCFCIRLQSVFRFVSQSCQMHLLNLFDLTNNNNNLEVFEPFYRQYICSSFVQDFFKHHIEDEWVHDDCPKKFSEAIIGFNEFYYSYAKSINQLYSRKFEMYSKKIKFFFMGEKNEAKNNFIVWLINLLNNPTNSLLFILFPELKIFVERIINVRYFLGFYARFHFFFTLLVLKLNYNLPRIKYEIHILKSKQNYKIIESKFFNLLILEFRCMICIFGTTVLTEKIHAKLLFFKSFISFIRLHIPNIMKCLFVDDFYDLNTYTYLESLLSVEFEPIGSLRLSSELEFSKIPKCRITAINQKLIVCKRDFSKEVPCSDLLTNCPMTLLYYSLQSKVINNLSITEAFEYYFESVNNNEQLNQ